MNETLDSLESILDDSSRRLLQEIYEPTVVGVPNEDARRCLMVMPDGELRSYGLRHIRNLFDHAAAEEFCLRSRDCGLSWQPFYPPKGCLGACVKVPGKNKYFTVKCDRTEGHSGTFCYISELGPDDANYREIKITDKICFDTLQPVRISNGRWLCSMQYVEQLTLDGKKRSNYHPVIMRSEDDGEHWDVTILPSAPRFQKVWPHQGIRWENNGNECSLQEMPDGKILLIIRTSLDYFYQSVSEDMGVTWSDPAPSPFHGTLTTPFLLRLHDGRVLFLWNNTQPLPELDKDVLWPPVADYVKDGEGEDVFTNRDANHAAITEDGKHWIGFRELGLNEIRNAADFRSAGGMHSSADKSVHQFQAIELPYNKILVCYGQHEISRKLVIFDLNWLYETKREENFNNGLKNCTTHMFIRGVCDSHIWLGIPGHCAWNRTNGALLMPDPTGNYREALQICRIHDPRLYSERQGVAWNFPAMQTGEVNIELYISGAGLRISLMDRWFNACDRFVGDLAPCSFTVDRENLPIDQWITLRIVFDCKKGSIFVYYKDQLLCAPRLRETTPNGFSYLHLQTIARVPDYQGTFVRRMEAHKL